MRDGGFLARLIKSAHPSLGDGVGTVWLSRRLCLTAALDGADDQQGLCNLLIRARGVAIQLSEAMAELGLEDFSPPVAGTTPLDDETLPVLLRWLATTPTAAHRLRDHVHHVRTAILTHLHRRGALGRHGLALADIGYAGNLARALAVIFRREGIDCPLRAVLVASTPGCQWARLAGAEVKGCLIADGQPDWLAAPLIRHREVLESLCASPLGELIGYCPDGNPITAPSRLSAPQSVELAAIQSAAAAFCATAAPMAVEQARQHLLNLLLVPSAEQAARLGTWVYEDDLAVGGCRTLAATDADGVAAIDTDGVALGRDRCLWPAAAALNHGMDRDELIRRQTLRHPAITPRTTISTSSPVSCG
ncbi:MAG: hypothetical protein HYU59_06780 [Magnetospirillum gryphiswaldense]|nr:hypothetical protein [Magnetospirillum gryphiswaldense]